jgi:hypothetical protein
MAPYTDDQTKKEPFHDVEELSSGYNSDTHSSREDLPLFEAKSGQHNILDRALAYAKDSFAKGEFASKAPFDVLSVLIKWL